MKTVYSEKHLGHAGNLELIGQAIVPAFEKPSRAEIIKARVESERLGPIIADLRKPKPYVPKTKPENWLPS